MNVATQAEQAVPKSLTIVEERSAEGEDIAGVCASPCAANGRIAAEAVGSEACGTVSKDVKAVVEGIVTVAAEQLKKNGSFKFAGALNLKLKKKPARAARKGVNPFTKEPCVFKAKPASKTVRAFPMKKFKEMIN